MSAFLLGRTTWGGERDDEGYRTWHMINKVHTTSKNDGPSVVMNCPGLPAIGSFYNFGNDSDTWAFCYPRNRVTMFAANSDYTFTWLVENTFSNKPLIRCQTTSITNPLLEPTKVGGSYLKYTEEATVDLNGNPLLSSSWERFRGKEVEFDANRPTLWFEQNYGATQVPAFGPLVDCVNNSVIWNINPRCLKLDNISWERLLWGICTFYYRMRYEFSINFNTFDRNIQDEGTKVLNGHWGATTGTGCTINITVSGSSSGNSKNPITSVTLGAGGTGYPTGSSGTGQVITLAINGPASSISGTGASVYVQTNSAGVVTGIATGVINGVDYGNGIANGGQGYPPGTTSGVATTGSIWVLDKIAGQTPNPNNPQHFIRYKDLNGENSRVILDGKGQPAIATRPGVLFVQKYVAVDFTVLGLPMVY